MSLWSASSEAGRAPVLADHNVGSIAEWGFELWASGGPRFPDDGASKRDAGLTLDDVSTQQKQGREVVVFDQRFDQHRRNNLL
jgi:hypothetical protein